MSYTVYIYMYVFVCCKQYEYVSRRTVLLSTCVYIHIIGSVQLRNIEGCRNKGAPGPPYILTLYKTIIIANNNYDR